MKKHIIKIRSAVLVLLTHKIALPVLRYFRRRPVFNYSELELYMLPEGTLGSDLYIFLATRNLPLLKYYARHDLKHVLLGYDTTDEGEVCLQSFMLGNGRISFPVLATVAYGFLTMPEYWKPMRRAFWKGRKAAPVHGWKWNEILTEQTTELRNKITKIKK
jgi:ubiquinone biosynthesis protein Coq4